MASERVIAPSRRPDGTLRKAVRIRAGHVSEELDQVKYVSKGTKIREELKDYTPGAAPKKAEEQKQGTSRAQRRKRNKKDKTEDVAEQMQQLHVQDSQKEVPAAGAAGNETETSDTAKELRKLRKKLRQIDDLIAKKDSGAELEPEQEKKLTGRDALAAQIAELEKQQGAK